MIAPIPGNLFDYQDCFCYATSL